jgi:Helix-turn-helix domain
MRGIHVALGGLDDFSGRSNGSRNDTGVTAVISDTAADYGLDLAPVSRPRRHDSLRAMTAAPVGAPRLYSVAEVCELLQCDSEDWLKDRVRSGQFPARRVCRHLRFSVHDIENIIAACAVTRADDLPVPTSRQRRKNPLVGVTGNVRVG